MKKSAIGIILLSIFIAVLPIISVLLASLGANVFECNINEGGTSPCPTVFGDMGEVLTFMGIFGWFVFYTVPAGLCGVLVGIILLVISLFRGKKPVPVQPE
jgi:hypothetical protein